MAAAAADQQDKTWCASIAPPSLYGSDGRAIKFLKQVIRVPVTTRDFALMTARQKAWIQEGSGERAEDLDFYLFDDIFCISLRSSIYAHGYITKGTFRSATCKTYYFRDATSPSSILVVLWNDDSETKPVWSNRMRDMLDWCTDMSQPVQIQGYPRNFIKPWELPRQVTTRAFIVTHARPSDPATVLQFPKYVDALVGMHKLTEKQQKPRARVDEVDKQ